MQGFALSTAMGYTLSPDEELLRPPPDHWEVANAIGNNIKVNLQSITQDVLTAATIRRYHLGMDTVAEGGIGNPVIQSFRDTYAIVQSDEPGISTASGFDENWKVGDFFTFQMNGETSSKVIIEGGTGDLYIESYSESYYQYGPYWVGNMVIRTIGSTGRPDLSDYDFKFWTDSHAVIGNATSKNVLRSYGDRHQLTIACPNTTAKSLYMRIFRRQEGGTISTNLIHTTRP